MEGGGAAAGDSANHTMLLRLLKELNSPLHVQLYLVMFRESLCMVLS